MQLTQPETTYALLGGTRLFAGFSRDEIATLLPLLCPVERHYAKGEVLLLAGAEPQHIGVVLRGTAEAVKVTHTGAQLLVGRLGPGRVYGDVLAVGTVASPVTVSALGPVAVLLLPGQQLYAVPKGHAELFRRLLANLVAVLADKYFALDKRVDLLLVRGLRRRIAAFLLDARAGAGVSAGATFTIPYNRAQLAAFLGCERSALSRELSQMAAAGLIETRRSAFRLPNEAALRALF